MSEIFISPTFENFINGVWKGWKKKKKKTTSKFFGAENCCIFEILKILVFVIDKTDGCNWNDRVHGKATVWWRPFIFWRTREGFLLPLEQYPFIRLCCGRFNTSLPSSIPAERLFSFTEIIFYLRRSWLTPENIWKFQGNQTGCWLKWSVVRQTIVCIFFLFVFFWTVLLGSITLCSVLPSCRIQSLKEFLCM